MASKKFQSWEGAHESTGQVDANNWRGETFTPEKEHTITSVYVYASKVAAGTLTLIIKAVDGSHKPTGSILDSHAETMDGWDGTLAWREIILDGQDVLLLAGIEYCWYLTAPGGHISSIGSTTAGGYSRGGFLRSTNQGSTWTWLDAPDHLFQEWGIGGFKRGWWSK